MKLKIKKEKFFSDGITENSKRFVQELEIIESSQIVNMEEKKPYMIKGKEIKEIKNKENKNELEKDNGIIEIKKKDFQDINNDAKPDYQNDQEKYENILRRNFERRIKKKKKREKKDRDNERELMY